jgi:hypothetical protein
MLCNLCVCKLRDGSRHINTPTWKAKTKTLVRIHDTITYQNLHSELTMYYADARTHITHYKVATQKRTSSEIHSPAGGRG